MKALGFEVTPGVGKTGVVAVLRSGQGPTVLVRTPTPQTLTYALGHSGYAVAPGPDGAFRVTGADAATVGALAFRAGVELHELVQAPNDLEAAFLALTADPEPDGRPHAPVVEP